MVPRLRDSTVSAECGRKVHHLKSPGKSKKMQKASHTTRVGCQYIEDQTFTQLQH